MWNGASRTEHWNLSGKWWGTFMTWKERRKWLSLPVEAQSQEDLPIAGKREACRAVVHIPTMDNCNSSHRRASWPSQPLWLTGSCLQYMWWHCSRRNNPEGIHTGCHIPTETQAAISWHHFEGPVSTRLHSSLGHNGPCISTFLEPWVSMPVHLGPQHYRPHTVLHLGEWEMQCTGEADPGTKE